MTASAPSELSLLLVEDHDGDARLVQEHLRDADLGVSLDRRVDLRDGGPRDDGYDVVLLDLGLPGSTGAETVRRYRELDPETPVVVLTGLGDPDAALDALRAGADEYLIKDEVTSRALERTLRFVHERHQAQRATERALQLSADILESLDQHVALIDQQGTILRTNAAWRRFAEGEGGDPRGYAGENYLAVTRRAAIEDEDARAMLRGLEAVLEGRTDRFVRTYPCHGPEQKRWFRATVTPLRSEAGGGAVVSHDSVTDEILERRERRRREEQLRSIVELAPVGIVVSHEADGTFVEVNRAFARLIGYPPGEIVGRSAVEMGLWENPERRRELVEKLRDQDGRLRDEESVVRTRSGETRRVLNSCRRLDIGGEGHLLWTVQDVTHRIERERELEETAAALEAERSRLSEVFERSPAWVATLRGPDHVFEMANPAYYDLVGDRELVGRPVADAVPEVAGGGYVEMLDRVYRTGETVEREETALVLDRDGGGATETRYVSFVCQPRREEGEVVGVIASGVDVTEQVEQRRRARRAEERWATAVEVAPVGIVITDPDTGEFLAVNRATAELLGHAPDDLVGRTSEEVGFWRDPERRGEIVARVRERGSAEDEPLQFVTRAGEVRHGLVSVASLPASDADQLIWTLQDVTEDRQRREALRRSENRYRTLVETMAEATVIIDREGRISFANAAAESLLDLEKSDITDRTYDDPQWRITATEGGPVPERELPFRRVMETGRPVRDVEHAIEKPDGSRRILAINAAPLGGEAGSAEGVVATMRDVTERHRLEEELRHRALHDVLTGLANRSLFRDRLEQALARGRREGEDVGLLILDLNRFKQINDHLGHTAGDRLLQEVARRVEAVVREQDTVARLGGDEFAVVLPSVEGQAGIAAVRDRLADSLGRPFQLAGEQVEIDVTVGGVLADSEDTDAAIRTDEAEDMIRYADLALYRAKDTRGAAFHLFHPEEDRKRAEQLGREQELRRALREAEFEVFFQPIVRLEGGDTWAVEPLARWRHPERGLVPPDEFIPLAEETGLIHELGHLLLEETCARISAWPRTVRESTRVTPNLSGRQFDEEEFVDALAAAVGGTDLDLSQFWFEVTESVITRATGQIHRLRELGARVLVDDFGTGYSSFHYLRDLEVDGLKIGMPFVRGMTTNSRNRALVETMITMGRTMELITVAEGVETEEQRDTLRQLGCPLAQGYLFARPMPADSMAEHLAGEAGPGG